MRPASDQPRALVFPQGNPAHLRRSSHSANDPPRAKLVPTRPGQAGAKGDHRCQLPPKSPTRRGAVIPPGRAAKRSEARRGNPPQPTLRSQSPRRRQQTPPGRSLRVHRVASIVRIDPRCRRSANRFATITTEGSIGKHSSLVNANRPAPGGMARDRSARSNVAIFAINRGDYRCGSSGAGAAP